MERTPPPGTGTNKEKTKQSEQQNNSNTMSETVKLISKEGTEFDVPLEVAKMSKLVVETTNCDEENDDDEEMNDVPVPNVRAEVLTKVIEYCKHHQEDPMKPIQTPLQSDKVEELVQPWYAEFCKVPRVMLFELVTAANFMDIKPLLDLTCLAVAVMIRGKPADELRKMFNISDTFSPEEEAQVKEENKWCEQPQS